MAEPIIPDNSISGNKVHGGVISEFQSIGIQDLATQTSLVVTNGTATVDRIRTKNIDGNIDVSGNMNIAGGVVVNESVVVAGNLSVNEIDAKVIRAEQIVGATGAGSSSPNFTAELERGLDGQGLKFTHGDVKNMLVYRTGGKLWSTMSVDLHPGKAYSIDNVDVLSATELGKTVTKSNLREVGALKALTVNGHASLGNFAFFGTDRLGLNTEQPNAVLSIVDNNVEIIVGATPLNVATIGSYTNHDVAIVTDNIPRITAKRNGEVHIGDENFKNGVLKVHGTIEATAVVTDNRVERSSPLMFTETRNTTVYGLGLVWQGTTRKQLVMMAEPDRLWSTESFELSADKAYYIGGKLVLNNSKLGDNVTESNLTKVGTLQTLTVAGETTLDSTLKARSISADSIDFTSSKGQLLINQNGINASTSLKVNVGMVEELYVDRHEIVLGNKQNTKRPVKVFGPLTVGINNPDPDVSLAVSGNISFADKKFITGTGAPTSGAYNRGDICWNSEPTPNSYIGWVCLVTGTPGEWLPFGAINRQ